MLLRDLSETSGRVRDTRARKKKIALLADLLRKASLEELPVAVAMLAGAPRQGKIGIGYAVVGRVREACPAASSPTLSVMELDGALSNIASMSGSGSASQREVALGALLSRATADEQEFIVRLLLGEIRQGALEAILVEVIAEATETDKMLVRRAVMLSGDLGRVAVGAKRGGDPELSRFSLQLFRPVQPMLAQPAESVSAALSELGDASLEYKLDGARVQVHKDNERVEVYTRNLNIVTPAVPEIVEAALAMPVRAAIFDGEAIALRDDGSPHPFQVTMRRFGRRLDVDSMRQALPLTVRLFDCLRIDDDTLIDDSSLRRWSALESTAPLDLLVPRIVVSTVQEARDFMARALDEGHEGVMAKALNAPYEAGKRGRGWRKLKTAHTLDLVVIGVEWGSGRREGWLSNLHLAARDEKTGSFVMLGKTFKGLTDELLKWQTEALLAREIGREGHVVHVRPELVVEIAFNDVQASPHYPAGMALRFARVKRYREDKSAAEADTLDAVRAIFAMTAG
ncbi:ATP-dependent DNA ligase [Enhygromyxa salina]|uniref:ATP-dependent DNA ligase n=1 Tax=Enhygromyxa salina TaxID=215803 RepID=UPI000D03DFD7|nr:ATP-dependent DNA ligase [Enhygromyxa salina]